MAQQNGSTASRSTHSSKRGFAAMSKGKQRQIASKGGHASHGGRVRSRSSG